MSVLVASTKRFDLTASGFNHSALADTPPRGDSARTPEVAQAQLRSQQQGSGLRSD